MTDRDPRDVPRPDPVPTPLNPERWRLLLAAAERMGVPVYRGRNGDRYLERIRSVDDLVDPVGAPWFGGDWW